MNGSVALSIIILGLALMFLCVALVLVPDILRETVADLLNTTVIASKIALAMLVVAVLVILSVGVWQAVERMRTMRAQRRKVDRETAMTAITVPANSQVFVYDNGSYRNLAIDARWIVQDNRPPSSEEVQAWALFHSLHATRRPQVSAHEAKLLEAARPVDLLSFLRPVERGLIVGASNAGKTTLLRWLVEERRTEKVVVIDPHCSPSKWPCQVIGLGGDHKAISEALDGFLALMSQRYKEIGAGRMTECGHPKITLIVDEWMGIAQECDNASYVFRRLLTEARKANIGLWLGSHSERVEPLALKGRGDLKDGLVIVKLNYNQITRERSALVRIKYDDHTDEYPAILPGTFDGQTWTVSQLDPLELPQPEMTEEEARILAEYDPARSMRQNSQAIWGAGKIGKYYNDLIEETLAKYGER